MRYWWMHSPAAKDLLTKSANSQQQKLPQVIQLFVRMKIQLWPSTTTLPLILLAAVLVLLRPAHVQAVAAVNPPRKPGLGFHIGQGDAAHFAAAQAAGGQFAIVVFSWQDIEPTPNYLYWETPDAALRAAEFYGLKVVARLDRPPDWARTDVGPTPWSLDAYTNFVRQVAQRYGSRLAGVIIWNEPNLALEWDGHSPNPRGYAALLSAAYPAIKQAAPALPVLAASLAFTLGDGSRASDDLTYLEALYAAGAAANFDILAAHPYGFGQPPSQPPARDRLNFRRLELQRAVMAANDDGDKPIWITEMGWRTSAPAADRWQVVTAAQQREYTLAALAWATRYPWLERMAVWELAAGPDPYGYALWQGEESFTPAYSALQQRYKATKQPATAAPAAASPAAAQIEILAADVTVRLGDRGDLHPHWVHLHRGGRLFSPDWQGTFFLTAEQATHDHELVLATMQVDQPTNRIEINGRAIGLLRPRTRPDPTSTWVTQRLAVDKTLLQAGPNTISLTSGLRLPVRQYGWWRWENFQFRELRLERPFVLPAATSEWRAQPAPSGWAESNRLRLLPETTPAGSQSAVALWLSANRRGQLWRLPPDGNNASLLLQTSGVKEKILLDAAGDGVTTVAAAADGLLWRSGAGAWQRAAGAPQRYAPVVLYTAVGWYAGFAGEGVWQAETAQGPWQPAGLDGRSVLDLAATPDLLFAATDSGVYRQAGSGWERLPAFPDSDTGDGNTVAGGSFITRLWVDAAGSLVVRSNDRLWRWTSAPAGETEANAWQLFGPADLQGTLLSAIGCCGGGTLLGTNQGGLWQQAVDGGWQRVDGDYFAGLEIVDGLIDGTTVYVATANGLFAAGRPTDDARPSGWRKVKGLPATITDLLVAPQDANLWVAATPAGVYRSRDGGQSWQPISPPWIVWDLGWGVDGRLWAALADGLATAQDAAAASVTWRRAGGMEGVTFFTVSPDPAAADHVWAGAWGNAIGVSSDGGATLLTQYNGLETLSVLAILRHPTPGQFTIGTIEGLYRSDDGGASWFKLPGELARQTVYALQQTPDGALWAGAANGLWHSQDYGASWQRTPQLPPTAVIRIGAVNAADGSLLWAGSEDSGLWWSQDNGATWRFAGLAGRSVYALLPDAERQQLLAATDAGIWRAALAGFPAQP